MKVRPAKSQENNVGIPPHVPLDLDLSALLEDFDRIFPGSVGSRIKSNTPTRTVKKIFKDEKFLEKSIKSLNLQSIWLAQHTRIQKDLATK